MSQLSIFDCFDTGTKPLLIGDKKIRIIETFSGIGAQLKAFEMLERDGYLPNGFESWKTSDWEYNAVLSYQAIHRQDDKADYSQGKTKEQIASELYFLGISSDGKTPLTLQQIQKIPEKKIRPIYNAFKSTNNLGSITGVHAKDLEIVEKDKYTYVFTYSFPCQSLSMAGKQHGLGKETRSGLLWEIERILTECISTYSESEWG